jgi:hypothetical protein
MTWVFYYILCRNWLSASARCVHKLWDLATYCSWVHLVTCFFGLTIIFRPIFNIQMLRYHWKHHLVPYVIIFIWLENITAGSKFLLMNIQSLTLLTGSGRVLVTIIVTGIAWYCILSDLIIFKEESEDGIAKIKLSWICHWYYNDQNLKKIFLFNLALNTWIDDYVIQCTLFLRLRTTPWFIHWIFPRFIN